MTKHSSLFRRPFISTVFLTFLCLSLLRNCASHVNIDLSSTTLDPLTTGLMIKGNANNDNAGFSVSRAGDINKDGYDDIVIGAYGYNNNRGAVYVIYGGVKSSMSNIDLGTTLDPLTTGFMIKGNADGDYFGYSVSTAGDFNKDGYDDILIGAPWKSSQRGAVYVIYGGEKSSMKNIDLSTTGLDPTRTGFMIIGAAVYDYFGKSVSFAGDMDNNGYDDIIAGAPNKYSNTGFIYVIYGQEKSWASNIDLSVIALDPLTTGFIITGQTFSDNFGCSVSTAGDINKDGHDDILVGACGKTHKCGAVYVIYGGEKSSMPNRDLYTTGLDPRTTGFRLFGSAFNDQLGISVSAAGDIDNDGYDDIIVGADGFGNRGKAYAVYGQEKSSMSHIDFSILQLDPLTTGFGIVGNAASDRLGQSVGAAGDINNDGYDDIIVGAPGKNSGQGAAYVIYGGPKSSMKEISLFTKPLDPLTTGFMIMGSGDSQSAFGYSVSAAGKTNKDGSNDIIVGAYQKSSNKGAAYVIFGDHCPSYCSQCTSPSECTQCSSSYFLYQERCFDSCPIATFKSTDRCKDCPSQCSDCTSLESCQVCRQGYFFYQSKCLDSCPTKTFVSTDDKCIDCPSYCSSCSSQESCQSCLQGSFMYQSKCYDSCPTATFPFTEKCEDCPSPCSSCISQESCQGCLQGYFLSNSLCVVSLPSSQQTPSSSLQTQEKAHQTISSGATGMGSVVSTGNAVFPLASLVSKIVQNTRYLNISVTDDLAEIYQTWNTDMISWEVPNVLSSDEDHFKTPPSLFDRYELESSFLANFWPTLLNVGIGLTVFLFCHVLLKLFKKVNYEGWVYSLAQKLMAGAFNFALVQAYTCLDDILFYLVLDAKTNPFNTFFSWTSLICSIVFLLLGCLLVFFNFWIIKEYQNIKNQGLNAKKNRKDLEVFYERNQYWEVFYSDFNDHDLWSQSFLALLIIRSMLSSFIIAVLYEYPLLQTSFLIVLDGATILFLFIKDPFKTLRGKLAQGYFETITLLVHIFTFTLSLEEPHETLKEILSTGIIYLNTALVTGGLGFMFIEIYETIKAKLKERRRKREQNSINEKNQEAENLTKGGNILKIQKGQDDQQISSFKIMDSSSEFHENNNSNLAFIGINTEPLDSNFNADNLLISDLETIHKTNEQKDQSALPIIIRRKLRILKPLTTNESAISNQEFPS